MKTLGALRHHPRYHEPFGSHSIFGPLVEAVDAAPIFVRFSRKLSHVCITSSVSLLLRSAIWILSSRPYPLCCYARSACCTLCHAFRRSYGYIVAVTGLPYPLRVT